MHLKACRFLSFNIAHKCQMDYFPTPDLLLFLINAQLGAKLLAVSSITLSISKSFQIVVHNQCTRLQWNGDMTSKLQLMHILMQWSFENIANIKHSARLTERWCRCGWVASTASSYVGYNRLFRYNTSISCSYRLLCSIILKKCDDYWYA